MTTWYVDLDASYTTNIANSGVATNSPLGGIAGIQRIVSGVAVGANTFAAGESINVRYSTGTNNKVSNLIRLRVTTGTSGTLAPGDTVHSVTTEGGSTPDAGNGYGTIAWVQSATIIWIELVSGTWAMGAGHYVAKLGDEATTHMDGTISDVDLLGVRPNVAGSAAAGHCWLVGCNGVNFTENANRTRVVIDATSCEYFINASILLIPYWGLRHIAGSNAMYGIFRMDAQALLRDCLASNSGMHGFFLSDNHVLCEDCIATSNGLSGFSCEAYTTLLRCVANSNTQHGFAGNYASSFIDCLAYDNSYSGISDQSGIVITGCVIDGNKRDGITLGAGHDVYIYGNRITNNSYDSATYYGINLSTVNPTVFEDYNVFYNNSTNATPGTQHCFNVTAGANSLTAASVADQGYTNVGGNVFTLTSVAVGRRMSASMADGLNTVYVTAGLVPAAAAPPAGEVVLNGTAYEGATGAVAASGSRVDAAVGDVKAGVKYGDPDDQLTGELVAGGGVGVRYGGALRGA